MAIQHNTIMKICLIPPTSDWAIQTGFLKTWEDMVADFPLDGEGYSLVNDESLADFSIYHTQEDMNSRIADIIKPLSSRDIQRFTWDMADRPTGRLSGFYCSLPKRLFDHRRHSTLSYPIPFNEFIEQFPRADATLDFSFLGKMTAGVRVRLVDHFADQAIRANCVVRESAPLPWSWSQETRSDAAVMASKWEYIELIRRSKFVLCPRGYGTGTFRMFESMQAGRVPVIISDDYVFPSGIDWSSCSITVPEHQIQTIPAVIESRLPDWEALADNARAVWEQHFSPQKMMDTIAARLHELSRSINEASFSSWKHSALIGSAILQEYVRPIAGQIRKKIGIM